MGIWLFDEKERQLALNVLQSILSSDPFSDSENSTETTEINNSSNSSQLKPISVTDLLGNNKKSESKSKPSILEILSKAKIAHNPTPVDSHETRSLESKILMNFKDLPQSTSLKSFINSVCQFLQTNPQLLASLHRQLTDKQEQERGQD